MSNEHTVDKTIHELDTVVLLRDLEGEGLVAGDQGTVVHAYQNADAFEVEFPDPSGDSPYRVVTLDQPDLLKLQPSPRHSQSHS